MGTRKSIFQPDHSGKHDHTPNSNDCPASITAPQVEEGGRVVTKGFAGRPKSLKPVPPHFGMTHTGKDGSTIAGISATAVNRARADAQRLEQHPASESLKAGANVPVKSGMRSRTLPHDPDRGGRVLDGALKSGANKMPSK
jgi:hypothetical protein